MAGKPRRRRTPFRHQRLSPARLCEYVRERLGDLVRVSDLAAVVGRWPAPVQVIDRLVAARLAERRFTEDVGKGRVLIVLVPSTAPPKPKKKVEHCWKIKTRVTFAPGLPAVQAGTTRTPRPGIVCWVKVEGRQTRVRYLGKTPDGWLVQAAGVT